MIEKSEKSVIIIGAGPAGLTAAYQLLTKTEIKPIVLEESEYIGGISRTAVHNKHRMDLGGHRFFTKNKKIMDIWKRLMPVQGSPAMDDILLKRELDWSTDGPNPEKEVKVFLKRKRVSRIFFLRKFFDYPIVLKKETFLNMGFVRTIKVAIDYLCSLIHKRKEKSLEDFYINRFGKHLYEMFFEDFTEKLWGIHPSEIAPDWGAQRVKGLSLLKVVLTVLAKPFTFSPNNETSMIEEFYYPKLGPGQLWEAMAEEIIQMGGEIVFNTSVRKLSFAIGNQVKLQTMNQMGKVVRYSADTLFSSMPIKDLIEAMDDVPPWEIKKIASALPYRDFITVGLLLNKLIIKNTTKIKTLSNLVPDCWIYIQERDVKLGRLQIFNNWSPYLVDKPKDTVWIGLEYFCNEGDELWSMKNEEFISYAIDELEKIDIANRQDVLDSTIIKVKKAYPAYFGSYNDFSKVKEYLNNIDNLYCIGRNGQHRYNNMDHSMQTAIEAVNCYINPSKNKEIIWDVNAEQEYHETKSD